MMTLKLVLPLPSTLLLIAAGVAMMLLLIAVGEVIKLTLAMLSMLLNQLYTPLFNLWIGLFAML